MNIYVCIVLLNIKDGPFVAVFLAGLSYVCPKQKVHIEPCLVILP